MGGQNPASLVMGLVDELRNRGLRVFGPQRRAAELEGIYDGTIDKDGTAKCFYHLEFDVPVCTGHWNPNTEPATTDPKEVDCIEDLTSPDPQKWDRYADLGDMFKIQVSEFSYDIPIVE